jgi:tetratricopeptide (TPR) repeat protein
LNARTEHSTETGPRESGLSVPRWRGSRVLQIAALGLLVAAILAALVRWHQHTRPGAAALRSGLAFAAEHRFPQAQQAWREGVQADPGYAPCYIQLGDLDMVQQRYPSAVACYQAAVRLTPNDPTLLLHLTRAAMDDQNDAVAYNSATRAAALAPENADAHGLLGILEARRQDRSGALVNLRRAHALNPGSRDYLINLVEEEMRTNDNAGASRDLAPWMAAHPDDAWADHLMSVIETLMPYSPANVNSAIVLDQKAQVGLPPDTRIFLNLGDLYLMANRLADANREFVAGLRMEPSSEQLLHGLAVTLTRSGDLKGAATVAARLRVETQRHQQMAYLRAVNRLQPHSVKTWQQLAALEEQDGDTEAAWETDEQMVRRNLKNPAARATLVNFYQSVGRPDLAKVAANPNFVP